MKIRPACRRDAAGIAALHTASWRSAYRDVIPAWRLGRTLDNDRQRHWRTMLAQARSRDVVLVADDGKQLLGFIAVWTGSGPAYIDNLHIQPTLRGQGIGKQLMRAAARRLVRIGHRQADLWAFVSNAAALRFYARLGGLMDRRGFDRFLRTQAPCQHVVWRRLERLAR